MKKRILSSFLFLTLTFTLTACSGNAEADLHALQQENEALRQQVVALEESYQVRSKDNNPIDLFFEHTEHGNSTAEMNFIANSWADAWKAEAYNAAEWLKGQLVLQEDIALVDAYMSATEEQLDRLTTMALYPIADLEIPQEDRSMHSGTLRGVMLAESYQQLWRDTVYQLLYVAPEYDGTIENGSYTFLFDADAMQDAINDALSDR